MKYIMTTALLMFFLAGKIPAQVIDFEIETTDAGDDLINITITMSGNNYASDISLWDKEPWNNGKEIKSVKDIEIQVYTFENLPKDNYIVIVTDSNGNSRGKPAGFSDNNE
ncbi:MAG: hypothetical protein JW723_02090 [Bacteroidales bacterium]|nr:hypothetical protein [Bacteroidales bacterium]